MNAVSNRRVFSFGSLIAECPHSCALLVGMLAICPHFTLRQKSAVDSFKEFGMTMRAYGAGDKRINNLYIGR